MGGGDVTEKFTGYRKFYEGTRSGFPTTMIVRPSTSSTSSSLSVYGFNNTNSSNYVQVAATVGAAIIKTGKTGAGTARTLQIQIDDASVAAAFTQSKRLGVNILAPLAQVHSVVGVSTTKGQIIQLAAAQTANALEVQDSGTAIEFAIGAGGEIQTNQDAANTNTPSGATAHQLPIYNEAGTLLGYIPIYAAAW